MKRPRLPRPPRNRDDAVTQLRQDLQTHSWPRAQMTLLVSLTGGSGLLASFLLLHAGLHNMALRYPAALLVAYGAFLLLLWLWLRTRADDWAELPDTSIDLPLPSGRGGSPSWSPGGGGQFGGGGSSTSFDAPVPLRAFNGDASGSTVGKGLSDGVGEGLGSITDAADADELVIPLLVIALAIGLALSSLYVIYSAPTLFAELLLDGALSASLYRRLRTIERHHWVSTALRRTALPFALTALLLAGAGWGLQAAAPGAHTLSQALQQTSGTP